MDWFVSIGQLRASSCRFWVFQSLQAILNLAKECGMRPATIVAHSAEAVNRRLPLFFRGQFDAVRAGLVMLVPERDDIRMCATDG